MSDEQLAFALKTKIIDFILASPLNIELIPDDVERAMYMQILVVIETHMRQPSFLEHTANHFNSLYYWIRRKVPRFF